jgi:PadR family transcriptional regulator
MGLTNTPSGLLPGTLELPILKTLVSRAKHGYGIVEHLPLTSDDVWRVGESALYPACWGPPEGLIP